jgi:hypothetical protein
MRTLIPQAYDTQWTRLIEAYGTARNADPATGSVGLALASQKMRAKGPVKTNQVPFRLVAGQPYKLFNDNPNRKGLMLENLDPVTNLNFSFGIQADATAFQLVPNGVVLLDFVCPTDSVWLFATLAVSGVGAEFAPLAGAMFDEPL